MREISVPIASLRYPYRHPPGIWHGLRRRKESISEEVEETEWKAQHRLHTRYIKLTFITYSIRVVYASLRNVDTFNLAEALRVRPRLDG